MITYRILVLNILRGDESKKYANESFCLAKVEELLHELSSVVPDLAKRILPDKPITLDPGFFAQVSAEEAFKLYTYVKDRTSRLSFEYAQTMYAFVQSPVKKSEL